MNDNPYVYDLSFVSSGKSRTTKPQIVFTFKEKYLEELSKRLYIFLGSIDTVAYFDSEAKFSFPCPGLFGNIEFGFGRCGLVTFRDEEVDLCIELKEGEGLFHATLTIYLLTKALTLSFENSSGIPNREQQINLETVCERRRSGGYGHAISGYISSQVIAWLREQAKRIPENANSVSVPKDVIKAMREVWSAVSEKDLKKYAEHCSGSITEDGRFILQCFGNACDVAIYPDSFSFGTDHLAKFECHNLDNASQQVTLIAGLAKLCENARKESGV